MRPPSPRVAVSLSLLACTLWFFAPLVFQGQVLFERDVSLFWHAQTDATVRAVGEASLPWWDPCLSFGEPLLEFPAQVFYPPTWPALLLPAGAFYSLSILGHHLFGGAGLYLFLRLQGLSRVSSVFGATLWMSSGPLLSVVNMLSLFTGSTWMPWIMLAADAARRSGRPAAAVLWGGSVAACLLTGAETVLMAGLASGAWFLCQGATRRDLRRRALLAGLAVVTSLLLAAAQWIPLLSLLSQTARADLPYRVRTYWSLHPLALLQLPFPFLLRGLPVTPTPELHDFAAPLFYSVFLGTIALALAAAGSVGRRRQGGLFFAVVAAFGISIALGRHTPLYDLAVQLLPMLRSIRYPVKLTLLVSLAVAVLASFGLEAVASGDRRARRWCAWALAGLCLGAAAAGLGSAPFQAILDSQPRLAQDAIRHHLVFQFAGALLASLAVIGVLSKPVSARLGGAAPPLLALLAIVQPAVAHASLNAIAPEALLHYRPPLLDAILRDGGTRIFSRTRPPEGVTHQRALAPIPAGMDPAVALAVNFKQMLVPQVTRLFAFPSSYELDIQGTQSPAVTRLSALAFASDDSTALLRLLQLGAVTHVVTLEPRVPQGLQLLRVDGTLLGDSVHLYRVPSPLPRCYVVDGVRPLDGDVALATLLSPGFDPRREAIIPDLPPRAPGTGPAGSCRVIRFGTARVEAEVIARNAAIVVLVDAHWPNWRATVDGVAQTVHRANVAFRAVAVASGRHSVIFSYSARSVWIGLGVSLVGVALSAAILAAGRRPGS